MERTARGKFEGGDAAWEEERLGSYSRSEVRLELENYVALDKNCFSGIVLKALT
jgi:hypothetical protein